MGALDAQGVYIYTEDDLAAPGVGFSEMLNKAGTSVSTQLAEIRSRRFPVPFSKGGELEVTVSAPMHNDSGRDLIIDIVRATVKIPSTGSAVTVGVEIDGVSILSSDVSIAAGASTATATPVAPEWPDGSELVIRITAVGSTTPGEDLTATAWAH